MIIIIIIYNFRKTIKVKYELIKELTKANLKRIMRQTDNSSKYKSEDEFCSWYRLYTRAPPPPKRIIRLDGLFDSSVNSANACPVEG